MPFSKAEAIIELQQLLMHAAQHKCDNQACMAAYRCQQAFLQGLIGCVHQAAEREGRARGLVVTPQETHD